jgi:hypothetical protein
MMMKLNLLCVQRPMPCGYETLDSGTYACCCVLATASVTRLVQCMRLGTVYAPP